MKILILTSLPHFLAVPFAPDWMYSFLVWVSTSCSIAWHASETGLHSPLGILDHGLAATWFLADCMYSLGTPQFGPILCLNGLIALLNVGAYQLSVVGYTSYTTSHSVWHLLSAAKATYVAIQLSK